MIFKRRIPLLKVRILTLKTDKKRGIPRLLMKNIRGIPLLKVDIR
jgi:hypothetical protein